MADKKNRLTIGLLVSGITEHFIISICRGVMHAAREADVNLVVLPGKYIDRDIADNKEIRYEYQYNTLFEYAADKTLDGVIVASDVIGCFASKNKIGQFLKKYENIPCVLVASKFPGYISINSDNYGGIREALEYLINIRKCRRFGMIGGPDDNTDARERREAFARILKEYEIPFTERNYVVSDLSKRDKKAAARFLDQNPDLEAVFCVNDDVAINLYEEMEKRDLVPGKDILVFGYDNSAIASKVSPTLSSIWTDKNELGEKALLTVLGMIRGEKAESLVLPGRFIMRESVGGKKNRLKIEQEEYENLMSSYIDSVFYNARYEESKKLLESREKFQELLHKLFYLLEDEGDLYKNYKDILSCADQIQLEYADIDNLLSVYEEICNYICYRHKKPDKKYEIRQLFELLYRKMIRSMNHQLGKNQEKQEKDNYLFKLFVSNTMQFESGEDQSYVKLISDVDFLGIRNGAVYLFEKPLIHMEKDDFVCPEYLYQMAVLRNGQAKPVHRKMQMQEVFRFEEICGARFSAVCFPLFSNEILYGILICNLSEQLFDNGEFLVNQLGSAVKMIDLLKVNERITRTDPLTGILNRRGFSAEAESRIKQYRQEESQILFAYIDMNNLKVINDQYGHEEGDFSLKLIGQILNELVCGDGIAGRIGGDEYACVLQYKEKDEGRSFIQKMNQKFDMFNCTSDKEYNVTVSAGICIVEPGQQISVETAMSQADEKLYEAKKRKIKNVIKVDSSNNTDLTKRI